MKDWRRMCKAYSTDDDSCCEGCPVADFREHGCGAIFEMADSIDWQRYADAIMAWAAEHPEPVYPTWGEWLESIEVIKYNDRADSVNYLIRPTHKINTRIPADIAQKLGLQTKETI
jgi:hypothetical protein